MTVVQRVHEDQSKQEAEEEDHEWAKPRIAEAALEHQADPDHPRDSTAVVGDGRVRDWLVDTLRDVYSALEPWRLRQLAALACLALVVVIAQHTTLDAVRVAHEHDGDCAIVVCLLGFAAACVAGVIRAAPPAPFVLLAAAPLVAPATPVDAPAEQRARASPVWLKRYLR